MRIGAMIGADGTKSSIGEVIEIGKEIGAAGLDHAWLANIFSYDAITALALMGQETSRIRPVSYTHLTLPTIYSV